jgi:hypothetical protein
MARDSKAAFLINKGTDVENEIGFMEIAIVFSIHEISFT